MEENTTWTDEWLDEQVEDALWVLDQCLGDGAAPFDSFKTVLRSVLQKGDEDKRGEQQQDYLKARWSQVEQGTKLKDLESSGQILKSHPDLSDRTEQVVLSRANWDESGNPLDAYNHKPILPDPQDPDHTTYAFGHKFGHEARRYVMWAEIIGLTRKEFRQVMNNPDLFQIENASLNSGSGRENTTKEPWQQIKNRKERTWERNRFFANLVEQYNQRRDERFRDWEEEYSR